MESKKEILLQPVISEKSYDMANSQNKYTFWIDPTASKIEVKEAIEKKYKVTVENVNTVTKPGKGIFMWRTTRRKYRRSDMRKAIIKLKDGDKIEEFFEN